MDISLAQHLLFDYFKSHDSYNLRTSYKMLNWAALGNETHREDECQLAIQCCLDDMVNERFVKKIETGSGKTRDVTYIIVNSLINAPSEISVSKQTSQNIRKVIQGVIPMVNLEAQYDPKSDLEESDLILLLEVITVLSNQLQKEMEKNNIKKTDTPETNI